MLPRKIHAVIFEAGCYVKRRYLMRYHRYRRHYHQVNNCSAATDYRSISSAAHHLDSRPLSPIGGARDYKQIDM